MGSCGCLCVESGYFFGIQSGSQIDQLMLLIFSCYSASPGYLSKVIRCFPLCLSSGDGRCRRG